MKRVLSGIQPSGDLHLGNYFGAIQQWLQLQESNECFFFLADLHALTSVQDAELMKKLSYEAIVTALSCGLDPDKCVLFEQSHISSHSELAWILSTITPMGLLERAHSYKDKIAKGLTANVGLFTYPILMAVDILLYRPDLVPVGKDQKQHVEMTRDIAAKFNHIYGEVFPLPEAYTPKEVAVVPGVDGQKMSKSYGNTIPLFAEEKELKKIIMGIVTDSASVDEKKTPEGNTIYELFRLVSPDKAPEMADRFRDGGYGYGEAKKELLTAVLKFLEPIWERRRHIELQKGYVESILEEGSRRAKSESDPLMDQIRQLVGI